MQLKTSQSIQSFHENFKKKYNFEEYTDVNKIVLFFGVYSNHDVKLIQDHKGKKIVWLAGTDATYVDKLKKLSEIKDAIFVAESDWIKNDLDIMGIKYVPISLCMDNLYNWKPCPLGDSLYWYGAKNRRYGKHFYSIIKKYFPNLNIIVADGNTYTKEQLKGVYAQCFAGIRTTEHDGMSQTVAEMGLMGRFTIWGMKTPCSLKYKGIEDVIALIDNLRVGYNPYIVSRRCRNWFIDNERKWTELALDMGDIDSAGIFEESKNRCGSIFRIMRKSVIDKLPNKFGDQQFERSYINEQMKKNNLKQLITSKNSGFIATEFKNDGNKGYGNFNDYLTKTW